jgi:hypothetical protein
MKLTGEQFLKLSCLQKDIETFEKDVILSQKDLESSNLRKRIHEIESVVLGNKISLLKQRLKDSEVGLVQYRTKLAQELGLQSLDEYIVDTETLDLKHEKEI